MSTRSTIWIKNEDGTFTGIYCHFDGYLSHNGAILHRDYKDIKKIKELISLGSLSCLGANPTSNDYPWKKPNDTCIAYHRDRGEELCVYSDVKEKELPKYYEAFNYFFIDGKWKYNKYNKTEMNDLEEELEKLEVEE